MPDQSFRKLFAETESTRWEPVGEVRSRARRRTAVRTATAAGALTVALVSAGIAVAQVRPAPEVPPVQPVPPVSPAPFSSPAPSSAPSPSSTPSSETPPIRPPSTAITGAMMLQPRDVGSGYVHSDGAEGDWTFEANLSMLGCPNGQVPEATTERFRALRKGPSENEDFVLQRVTRYSGDLAAGYLSAMQLRARNCGRVIAEDFTGDSSLLVAFDYGEGHISKLVVVQEGDLLTEIFAKPARTDAANRRLGERAAARLSG